MPRSLSVRVGWVPAVVAPVVGSGQSINATNTGLAYAGVLESALTSMAAQTVTTGNQTITGKTITGMLKLSGDNITVRNCVIVNSGASAFGVVMDGANCRLENCVVRRPANASMLCSVIVGGTNAVISRCDLSGGENIVTSEGVGTVIEDSYLHDISIISNPSGHADVVEVYDGSATIRRNRMVMGATVDGVVNIAPYSAGMAVTSCLIDDNFMDGGQAHVLIDNQAGGISNVKVRRNGHTASSGGFPAYNALQNNDGRPIVTTEAAQASNPDAILWGTEADKNVWGETGSLVPNQTGQEVSA